MRPLRIALLAVFFLPAALAAQPAPDAPLAQHVAHLLAQSGDGFAALRGAATYGPGSPISPSAYASTYPLRLRGMDASSEVRVNARWNVMHVTRIPVRDAAGVQALWAAAADEIGRAVPAGWHAWRRPAGSAAEVSHAGWKECASGGREVYLYSHARYEQPALYLIVYRFDAPCST